MRDLAIHAALAASFNPSSSQINCRMLYRSDLFAPL